MDLHGKTILVTGAAQGLGRKMAELIAQGGANLALVDLDQAKLVEAKRACEKSGRVANTYTADITDEATVEALFNDVRKDFSRIDGLVNNAGTNSDALLVRAKDGKVHGKMPLDSFNKVIAVDLRGVFLCGREAAVHMVESGQGGVIVNISSISRAGNIGQTNYAAAKAGVAAMTVTWAKELARHDIRVAGIAPGFCDTRMVANIKPAIRKQIVSRIPAGRLGTPGEIGKTVLFVLQNDYINGRILEIDGGLRI